MRALTLLLLAAGGGAASDVLIVADEVPAMEVLARQFRARAGASSQIAAQDALPASLASHHAVAVYIHRAMTEAAEAAFLAYTRGGGTLLVIHHSISSGKRKNRDWLPSLGVTLPTEPLDAGGYGYYSPATFDLVNVAPNHPVTTRDVKYQKRIGFAPPGEGPARDRDAFTIPESEIFVNHRLEGPRTPLLGVKWTDPRSGREYQQNTGGWHRPLGKGNVYYFLAGHRAEDFDVDPYAQILANVLRFRR